MDSYQTDYKLTLDQDLEEIRKRFGNMKSNGVQENGFNQDSQAIQGTDSANTMVISIDFGTTYSGVAYVLTANPTEVFLVKDWPGAKGVTYDKCPTLLKYETDGSIKWGFELDRSAENRIEAIKLLLDPDQPKPIYVPETDTDAILKRLGKPPTSVATDYLEHIFRHASQKIASKYPQGYFDLLKKQYVLTVPAVWSDKAKDATLRAARNAGIHPVKLVKEPEAAALFTLQEMKDKGLTVGDAFVVCDAGGGTVDLISYEIVSMKPFEVKELVAPKGGLAGSLMLNRRFEEYIKNVVGERNFIKLRENGTLARAMKTFNDTIKPGFYTSEDDEHYVNFPKAGLPDIPEKGLQENTLTVTKSTLQQTFEPIINDIDRLVKEQITNARLKRLEERHPGGKEIKALFLVGGFGASEYLYARLKENHPDIDVVQPPNAWSAIVRGAVLYNMPSGAKDSVSVVSNVSPKHYGTAAWSYDFDANGEDANQPQAYDEYRGTYRVKKMFWHIQKGDDLVRARPIELDFFRSYRPNPSPSELQATEILLESDLDFSPRHPREDMKANCTLKADLSVVPEDYFDKRSRMDPSGTMLEWWELTYKLVVTISSGPMQFSLKCHGKEYSSVSTEY